MGGLKGWALLLMLGIPLALYCALQVREAARSDASELPPDRGASQEQFAEAHAKSAAWLNEVRKAAAVAQQYRAPSASDAAREADTSAFVKAAATRAADLNDLDLFLSGVERPNFAGRLKPQYEKWMAERRELNRDADAVSAWLTKPPAITSSADAEKAASAVNALIARYSTRSRFSDNARAAEWRVKARLAVIEALAALADRQYREAAKEKLPLEPGANKVKDAVETLRALKSHFAALTTEVKQAEEEKARLEGTRAAIDAAGASAGEFAAREQLLALFAKDDLFTDATGAEPWLKQVAEQYRKTKDEATRALIRAKVQEFCEAFVPAAARLDDEVLIKGKAVPRKDVVIKYQEKVGAAVMRKPLSGDLDGANEFNLATRHPGDTTFVVYMGSEEYPRDLKPTELSKAAVLFNAERKRLSEGAAPKWTAKSVAELKMKCEARKELVDQLQTPGSGSAGKEPKVWTRLSGVAAGLAANPELFAGQ